MSGDVDGEAYGYIVIKLQKAFLTDSATRG